MDDDRKNYSKALSGFANSDGIIIWGSVLRFWTDERTKHLLDCHLCRHLDSYISRLVSPSVRGAVNHVIFENGQKQMVMLFPYTKIS